MGTLISFVARLGLGTIPFMMGDIADTHTNIPEGESVIDLYELWNQGKSSLE